MPQGATLRVNGYREFMIAARHAIPETNREVRRTFRQVGAHIQADAARRAAPKNARTAAGYRTSVRQRGIAVRQSRRKTTGKHPEYGSWQMRHVLIPAMYANQAETTRAFEQAIDRVADMFERVP